MKKVLLALCAAAVFAASGFAAVPIKLSLWNETAIPPADTVYGLEIGIGSYNSEVKGVAWNLVYSKVDSGLGWTNGLLTKTQSWGGVQSGIINMNESSLKGLSWGFLNRASALTGAQVGFINFADNTEVFGFQFGFFNYMGKAETGLQIGLINYLGDSIIFKWFPIVNAKF